MPNLFSKVKPGKRFIMISGCSGSGKTTLVKNLMDEKTYGLEYEGKIIATVFPTYGMISLGKYSDDLKTCGCDFLKGKENIIRAMILVWVSDWDIIVEGLYVGNASTFKRAEEIADNLGSRDYYVFSLMIDEKLALERVRKRSGRSGHNPEPLYVLNKRSKHFDTFLGKNCPGLKFKYMLVDTGEVGKKAVFNKFKSFVGVEK